MIRAHSASLPLLIAAIGCVSCSNGDAAGGGPGGTEVGNALSIHFSLPDGSPANNALARVRPSQYTAQQTSQGSIDKQLDSNGRFTLESIPPGSWVVEVIQDSFATLLGFSDSSEFRDTTQTFPLQQQATISGTAGAAPSNTTVYIVGTDHFASTSADGSYHIDSLPAVPLVLQTVLGVDTLRGYATPTAGSQLLVGPLAPESQGLLLDDFSTTDQDSRHRFHSYSGGGWWSLTFADGMLVQRQDSLSPVPVEFDSLSASKALHFQVTVPADVSAPWLRCLVQLGKNDSAYDVTEVDSIAFYAKGSGNLRLTFHLADSVLALTNPSILIALPLEWTRLSIPIDSIVNSGLPDPLLWRTNVKSLSWGFVADGELWLDDIRLIGASREDIWKRGSSVSPMAL